MIDSNVGLQAGESTKDYIFIINEIILGIVNTPNLHKRIFVKLGMQHYIYECKHHDSGNLS